MTVIGVVDLAHCGTTMTAMVLERIGVPMLFRYGNRKKLEDREVIDALLCGETFPALVEHRSGFTWGFKYPGAWKFAPLLQEYIPDAVYVAIYKDPVSVTYRRFGSIGGGKLAKTTLWMLDNIEGLNASGLDVHWLSYRDAIVGPCGFVGRLAGLAGVSVTGGQMDAALGAIAPPRGDPQ